MSDFPPGEWDEEAFDAWLTSEPEDEVCAHSWARVRNEFGPVRVRWYCWRCQRFFSRKDGG